MDHVLAAYLALQIEHVRLAEEVATLRQRAQEAEGVAQCMQETREILTTAGLIPAGTAPMFIAEAVLAAVAALREDAERLDWMASSGCMIIKGSGVYCYWHTSNMTGPECNTTRAAIDAARKGGA
jgi:hypothetical protein